MFKRTMVLIVFVAVGAVYANPNSDIKQDDKKKKIAKLYKKKCSKCHGKNGEGVKGKKKKPPINHLGSMKDDKLFDVIRKGYKGKIGKMPKLKKKYANDAEVKELGESL